MYKLLITCLLGASVMFPCAAAVDSEAVIFGMLPEKIAKAREMVFPALVFIRSVNDMQDEGVSAKVNASGSGVILEKEGVVLTNWHVINKADHIRCQTTAGDAFEAEVIGSDKDIDIALIKLKTTRADFPVAKLMPSSQITYGDFVLAMGAPWGMSRSVSMGIVSCPNRFLSQNKYTLYLQTDASISPGNSGGPLVNLRGEVIGINTLGGSRSGGDIGFAVPSSTILDVLADIRSRGSVNWSWSGIDLQSINDFSKNIYFEKGRGGVIIANIEPKSPAEKAGLKTHDRILFINGRRCDAFSEESIPNLNRFISLLPAGKVATLSVERGRKLLEIKLTPIVRGSSEGASETYERWGATLAEINRFQTPSLFHHKEQGLYFKSFMQKSNAEKSGFSNNDILISIDGQKVETLADAKTIYEAALKNIDNKTKMVLKVLRNGRDIDLVLDYATDYNSDSDDEFFEE